MKSPLHFFILILACLTSAFGGQLQSHSLLIYCDSLVPYPEIFEVSAKVAENRFQATFLLSNGHSIQREKAGIVAIVNYPPEVVSPDLVPEATAALQQIEPLIKKYPKFTGTLEALRTKWQNTLAVANQMKATQPAPKPTPAVETLSFTTTAGEKFENVTVSGTIADGIAVMSDSGIQRIPFDQLPKNLQERFHYEPKKVASFPTASPEPESVQVQQEKDVQAQREKEAQAQRNKLAQAEQETEAQLQKEAQARQEREAQIQREKQAQAEREKELQVQREKDAQAQQEKEIQSRREREAQEREALSQRTKGIEARKKEAEAKVLAEIQTQQRQETQRKLIFVATVLGLVLIASCLAWNFTGTCTVNLIFGQIRLSVILMIFFCLVGISSGYGWLVAEASAVGTLKRYLTARRWEDRLSLVRNPEQLADWMKDYYQSYKGAPPYRSIVPCNVSMELPKSYSTYEVNFLDSKKVYFLEKTSTGFKIDWEMVALNRRTIASFKADRPTMPELFRVLAKLDDYYNFDYRSSEKTYYSIEIQIPNQNGRLNGYIKRNSADGQALYGLLKDGQQHEIMLSLRYLPQSESSNIVEISHFVQASWIGKSILQDEEMQVPNPVVSNPSSPEETTERNYTTKTSKIRFKTEEDRQAFALVFSAYQLRNANQESAILWQQIEASAHQSGEYYRSIRIAYKALQRIITEEQAKEEADDEEYMTSP